jgi:hypothetical protein
MADRYDDTKLPDAIRRAVAAGQHGPMSSASPSVFPDPYHRVRRALRYAGHPADFGPAARPQRTDGGSGGTLSTPANGAPAVSPVSGGEVSVTTGDTIHTNHGPRSDAYGLHYRDTNGSGQAPHTGWIQFVAFQIESFDAQGHHVAWATGGSTPAGQSVQVPFSQGPNLQWRVDGLSQTRPFYEAGNTVSTVTPTSTEMSDRPDPHWGVASSLWRPPVAEVVERIWFETYLVRGTNVLFVVGMLCEDKWTAQPTAGNAVRQTRELGRHPATAMRRDQAATLATQRPGYDVYPTR